MRAAPPGIDLTPRVLAPGDYRTLAEAALSSGKPLGVLGFLHEHYTRDNPTGTYEARMAGALREALDIDAMGESVGLDPDYLLANPGPAWSDADTTDESTRTFLEHMELVRAPNGDADTFRHFGSASNPASQALRDAIDRAMSDPLTWEWLADRLACYFGTGKGPHVTAVAELLDRVPSTVVACAHADILPLARHHLSKFAGWLDHVLEYAKLHSLRRTGVSPRELYRAGRIYREWHTYFTKYLDGSEVIVPGAEYGRTVIEKADAADLSGVREDAYLWWARQAVGWGALVPDGDPEAIEDGSEQEAGVLPECWARVTPPAGRRAVRAVLDLLQGGLAQLNEQGKYVGDMKGHKSTKFVLALAVRYLCDAECEGGGARVIRLPPANRHRAEFLRKAFGIEKYGPEAYRNAPACSDPDRAGPRIQKAISEHQPSSK